MQMDHGEFLSGTCFGVNESFWHISAIRGEGEAQRVGPMWLKLFTSDHGTAVAILNSINLNDISGFIIFFISTIFLFISTWPGVFFPSTADIRYLAILAPPNHDWQWKYWHDWSTGRRPHGESLKMKGICMACWFRRFAGGPVEPTRNAGFWWFLCPMYFWNSPAKRWRCWRCLVFFHKSKAQIRWYQ